MPSAPRDKAWVADGWVSDHWMPVSPISGKLDADVRIRDAKTFPAAAAKKAA